jgi:hypothetical protein
MKERDDLAKEFTRLKDQMELQQLKSSALGGESNANLKGVEKKASKGYQLLHVLLLAIISLIIGALVK